MRRHKTAIMCLLARTGKAYWQESPNSGAPGVLGRSLAARCFAQVQGAAGSCPLSLESFANFVFQSNIAE